MSNAVLLQASLQVSVPLWFIRFQEQGGPTDMDFEWAREFADTLAARGDNLLYRSKKPGETADLFTNTARALAILAFAPGGVTFAGTHWEATVEDIDAG